MLAAELGLDRMFAVYERSREMRVEFADPFRRAARRLGIGLAGFGSFDPEGGDGEALADRVARSGAQGVYITGLGTPGGIELLQALRARLGDRIEIMAHDPFVRIADFLEFAGPEAARGLYISSTDVPPAAPGTSPEGRRFARAFGVLDEPVFGALQAAQATELILDAIARSDGTRASVLEELRGARVEDGILGDFRVNRHGDITPVKLGIYRVPRVPRPGAPGMFEWFRGLVLDRVITVPHSLDP
jgi:ABC-type branched-subunit amino acid transport system substrate-binding protein